jgi:methylenetetrahydrofolate dehydrogenase (NADP+) / methenyltetrahydrofolate cyclohydrolase
LQEVARGNELATRLLEAVRPGAAAAQRKRGRRSCIGILAGADEASRKFVRIKEERLAPIGIAIQTQWIDEAATTADVRALLDQLNADETIDAIFVQFPLPHPVDPAEIANAVAVGKDIDCSSEAGEAAFHAGDSPYIPVAPQAAMDLLADQLGDLSGRRIALGSTDDPFMRGLRTLLWRGEARVASIDEVDSVADALVIGESVPNASRLEAIVQVRVLLDAGYYLPPRATNLVPSRLSPDVYLPQYGNVGPLTVAHIARATVLAAMQRA